VAYLLALGRISVETGRTAIDARSYIHARASWQRLYRGPRVIWNQWESSFSNVSFPA